MMSDSSSDEDSRTRAKQFQNWFETRQTSLATRDSLINIPSSSSSTSSSSSSSTELIKDYEAGLNCPMKNRKVRFKRKRRDKDMNCNSSSPYDRKCHYSRSNKSHHHHRSSPYDMCQISRNIVSPIIFVTFLVITIVLFNFHTKLEHFQQMIKIIDNQQRILENDVLTLRNRLDSHTKKLAFLTSEFDYITRHVTTNDNESRQDDDQTKLYSSNELFDKFLSNASSSSTIFTTNNVHLNESQLISLRVQYLAENMQRLNNQANKMVKRMDSLELQLNATSNHISDESVAILTKRLLDTQVHQLELESKLNATMFLLLQAQKKASTSTINDSNRSPSISPLAKNNAAILANHHPSSSSYSYTMVNDSGSPSKLSLGASNVVTSRSG
ncbi:uncharacterized protein LOC141854199 [Brevipalpus obovatus]|uniref:uncharacterized protein LOC141854199 n=1 Tax=Brevipalpus obovatus TaxID=246614 RepID=UPI003D9DCCCC